MRVAHRTRIVGGVLFILVVALAGCTSASKPEAVPSLTGPGDLPIPPGFRQIETESVLIAFGGFQAGMVVYEGDREPSWVAQYYRGGRAEDPRDPRRDGITHRRSDSRCRARFE